MTRLTSGSFVLDTGPPFTYKKTQVAIPTRLEAREHLMSAPAETAIPAWPLPFSSQDWEQTPPAVQAYLRTLRQDLYQLQQRMATIEARLKRTSKTSNQPPPYRDRVVKHLTRRAKELGYDLVRTPEDALA